LEDKDNFWKDFFWNIQQFSFVHVNGDLCSYISFVLITWIIEFGVLKWWCISPLSIFQWQINYLFLEDLISLICVLNPSTKTMILQPNQTSKPKCIEKHSISWHFIINIQYLSESILRSTIWIVIVIFFWTIYEFI
jgi:hypothetical protein